MIYIDDKGVKHPVELLSKAGPYAYIRFADGTALTVRQSQLHTPTGPQDKPRRFIPPPKPYKPPRRSK